MKLDNYLNKFNIKYGIFDKIDDRYYYVYRITNIVNNKHYYGSRVSKIHPKEDLGTKYFSSSRDKEFMQDQKENPQNYKYKVVKIFDNNRDKEIYEAFLHYYFKAKDSDNFYNKMNASCKGGCYTKSDSVTCRDINNGNIYQVSKEEFDRRDDLVGIRKGFVNVMDINNNSITISKEEYSKRDDLNFHTKEMVSCKDVNGNTYQVSKEEFDRRDDLVGINKNKICGNKNGKAKRINIYNNLNELMFECHGDFKNVCKENGLPISIFKKSYLRAKKIDYIENGTPNSIGKAKNNGFISYQGWYARIENNL